MKSTNLIAFSVIALFAHFPAWAQSTEANISTIQVNNLLIETSRQGLVKNKYSAAEKNIAALNSSGQTDVAKKLAAALITQISSDLVTGQIKADDLNNRSIVTPKKLQKSQLDNIQKYINGAITADELVNQIKPTNPYYKKLVSVLQKYQEISRLGQAVNAPATLSTIKAGVTDKGSVLYARFRLNLLGYANDVTNPNLSDDLTNAIKAFQENQNLSADGSMGSNTWKILNQDLSGQMTQLKISIDRTRWLPDDLGKDHVFVNLAQQKLKLYLNSALSLEFKTINGRLDRQTPILFDKINYLLLNPTWTVPENILLADKVPMFIKNPQKVIDLRMKVIDDLTDKELDPFTIDWTKVTEDNIPYTLVQQPGKHNALGFIKFPMTNPYSIYLHDTDSRNLFTNSNRLLSSGCVRLEKPFEFAEKVLSSTEWTIDRLRDSSENLNPEATSSTRVKLAKTIPVYLFYLTAIVNEKDQVVLASDSYEIDLTTYNLLIDKK
ncbi:MAG: L,D-transpeptidase family protein [Pseudobdellovibrio sp.]